MTPAAISHPLNGSENRASFIFRYRMLLSAAVFAVLLFYSYVKLVEFPYLGFKHHPTLATIGDFYIETADAPLLKVGDRLLKAGSVTWQEYRSDPRRPFFVKAKPGEVIQLLVQRGDDTLTIPWTIPEPTLEEISDRLVLIWIPYVFWLMGTIALYTSKGADSRRAMYIAYNFITAVWIMAGLVSSGRIYHSAVVMRMGIWLSVPIYWHFHWLFPMPLPRFNKRFFLALYLIFGSLALAEWLAWMPAALFPVGIILALTGSLALLFAHLITNPEQRRSLGVIGMAVAFTVAPGILIMASYLTNSNPWSGASVLIITPYIPVAYYYAVFAQPRGRMGISPSYTITPLLIGLVTYGFLALGMLATQIWQPATGREVPLAVDLSAMVGLFTAILYPYVQQVLDRRVLGITIPPGEVLETYSARITTSLDIRRLAALLRDEVLPSLSIRQAALVVRQADSSAVEVLFQIGIPKGQEFNSDQFAALSAEAGRQRSPGAGDLSKGPCSWAELVLHLKLMEEEIGLLLLGRRDLGGSYSQADITALQALADQTALALVNINQAKQLHALYQHDLHNREAAQLHLARELHDRVLNYLAALANQMDDQRFTPELQAAYQKTVSNIRNMISGLRPSMLNYGLHAALQELMDDFSLQAAGRVDIDLSLPASTERYPAEVELQLFRIVQQAVQNALQHGSPTHIDISGALLPNSADLNISDNGTGFDYLPPFDMISLLEGKHFGLAGMYERAAMIDANLEIHSSPGKGTQISVRWRLPN